MKTIAIIAFLSVGIAGLKAQSHSTMKNPTDTSAIMAVLENNYFDGIYNGDVDRLGAAFQPDALLFGDINGVPYAKTLAQYLDGVKNRQSPKDSGKPFQAEVLSLQVVNSIAVAEARVAMYDFVYHDILSFHKIGGQWLIVNKMLTDTKP